ncbi:hypothetical protein C8Q78DRAFT_1065906 [Trametes maxima]|nr:hypothetical protein C8Q78DRAFT_1065906 [Trametes maxima]
MLASPLLPSPRFDEGTTYRPAKDLEAFNKLLPPPIEFVEGSSSGLLAVAEGKYQAINETPKLTAATDKRSVPTVAPKALKAPQSASPATRMLPDIPIEMSWPSGAIVGAGLNNTGNTCFLNSALQCLLHTPPLLHILLKHTKSEPCRSPKNSYCMACALRQVMAEVFSKSRPVTPYPVITKLQAIAKHMRRGRQEDSHEFLRYFVDALQRSSLAGLPGKVDPKVAEKTWVYKIFGGLLRSRVKCLSCGHNSDTFDRMLDLSVDIAGMTTLRDALKKFVAVDHLRGADKYKCEKCKKLVNADKQFTIEEAPTVLTVHLKRFSPMGRKIAHPVAYPERLTLQPYMSEEKFGLSYTLYGVISHAGGGPNSGHYYAHVKASNGSWYEMNDESVMRQGSAPTNMRSAYMLFYIREKGQALEAAVAGKTVAGATGSIPPPVPHKTGLVASMKKRKIVESEDEDENPKSSKTPRKFIGPRLPTPPPQTPSKDAPPTKDPQAETLKKKIAAAASQKAKGALQSLDQYGDDEDDDDDVGEKLPQKENEAQDDTTVETAPTLQSIATGPIPNPPSPPHAPATATAAIAPSSVEKSISPATFYGTPTSKPSDKKRKTPDGEEDASYTQWARKPISPPASSKKERRFGSANPFSRLKGGNNLKERRDSPGSPVVRQRKKRFLM